MEDVSRFRRTLEGVQAGSPQAIRELIDEYEPHVRQVIRRRLPGKLRGKFDSADFVQMVWATLFRDVERFHRLTEPSDLGRFLTIVARNKLVDEMRRCLFSRGRNVSLEQSWPSSDTAAASRNISSPSQLAIAREGWRRMLSRLGERERNVIWMRMQGMSNAEIAAQLQVNERTVRKILARLNP